MREICKGAKGLRVEKLAGGSGYSLDEVSCAVTQALETAAALGIERTIADITGGLSSMSAGMALAARDADVPIEFCRQADPLGTRNPDGVAIAKDLSVIRAEHLVKIVDRFEMVPSQQSLPQGGHG